MITVDRSHSAVLVMDFQTDILARLGDAAAPLVDRVAGVVRGARAAKIPVMYVVVGFRPGYPEVSPRNHSFGPIVQSGRFTTVTPGSDVHSALKRRRPLRRLHRCPFRIISSRVQDASQVRGSVSDVRGARADLIPPRR
jgi:nicotinamidase-related amidase